MSNNSNHIELHITGMHCPGCAMNVERALTSLEGVGKAAVSITDRTAWVDFDGQRLTRDDLARAITGLGFVVLPAENEAPDAAPGKVTGVVPREEKELHGRKTRALAGITVGLPLMIACMLFPHGMLNYSFALFWVITPLFIYASGPIFLDAWRAIRGRRLSMDVMSSAVRSLSNMGLKVMLLSGDREINTRKAAQLAGISQVFTGVLPHQKSEMIEKLQRGGASVAFAGDGINDAIALGRANLGIALRSGTDVAIESGRVVLMRDDLNDVPATIQLARKVLSRIRGNIFWAFMYNGLLIPVAAGALYPFTGLMLKPEFCGLAMALSSSTVLLFSLRLRRYVPPARVQS